MNFRLIVSVCVAFLACSTSAQAACSVIDKIREISPSYANVLLDHLPGIDATEDDINGVAPGLSRTFLVPAEGIYAQYVANVTFGYTLATADHILNESVLIQTLPNAMTIEELIQGSQNFRLGEGPEEHYGYDTFGDNIPYIGNGSSLYVGHGFAANASSETRVFVRGPVPQGSFQCLLYLDCAAEVVDRDIEACESFIHLLDNPLPIRTFDQDRTWPLETTKAADQLVCEQCSQGGPAHLAQNCGSAFEHTGCSCCNRYA